MYPPDNLTNARLAHAIPMCKIALAHGPSGVNSADMAHLFIGQFGVAVALAIAERRLPEYLLENIPSMDNVGFRCDVLQVDKPVVALVAVLMVHLQPRWARANERLHDELVHQAGTLTTWQGQYEVPISIRPPYPLAGHIGFDAFASAEPLDSTQVGHIIDSFKACDWFPSFCFHAWIMALQGLLSSVKRNIYCREMLMRIESGEMMV